VQARNPNEFRRHIFMVGVEVLPLVKAMAA
jgi:hypothetical protein